MRAFIAVTLPDEAREALRATQQALAESRADVRWVAPEHLHVTLKFLGEITEVQRQAIEELLGCVAAQVAPFTVRLEGVGAFPSTTAPRVVWAGIVEGAERLARLAEAIEQGGERIGLAREDRAFAAHVTLGRVRSPRRRQALIQQLATLAWTPPPPWQASSVTLYQSVLSPRGPTYNLLAAFPLTAPAPPNR